MQSVRLLPLISLFGLLSCSSAANEKTIDHRLDASALQQLVLEVGVGQVNLHSSDSDQLEITVKLRGERRWWFFSHKVGDVELQPEQRNGELRLSIPKDNTHQQWQLRIPAHLSVQTDLGVGQVYLHQWRNPLQVDVGVGQINGSLNSSQFQQIELAVGVGNVGLSNANGSMQSERHLVGGTLNWSGSGQAVLKANLGVGDISLSHQP